MAAVSAKEHVSVKQCKCKYGTNQEIRLLKFHLTLFLVFLTSSPFSTPEMHTVEAKAKAFPHLIDNPTDLPDPPDHHLMQS